MRTKHLTVMFTDIKNFTDRSSRQTREQLLKLLDLHDELIRPIFDKFGGNVVKTIGDAFLVTFESPTDAVLCGMAVQKKLRKYNEEASDDELLEVRVAINSGEVTLKNNDVFGEAVNIASRIEGIAEANEIYFTDAVYLSMNKSEVPSAEVGHRFLKGIPHEIKVYKVLRENSKRGRAKKRLKMVTYRAGKFDKMPLYKKILIGILLLVVFSMLMENEYGMYDNQLFIILYAFYARSLQIIARKTDTKHAWLAWVPFVNILYWVNIAGKSKWWYLLYIIPGVDLIFMALSWMTIAEIRGKNRWLGLLMLVPGVNIFVIGYLAYSE